MKTCFVRQPNSPPSRISHLPSPKRSNPKGILVSIVLAGISFQPGCFNGCMWDCQSSDCKHSRHGGKSDLGCLRLPFASLPVFAGRDYTCNVRVLKRLCSPQPRKSPAMNLGRVSSNHHMATRGCQGSQEYQILFWGASKGCWCCLCAAGSLGIGRIGTKSRSGNPAFIALRTLSSA